MSAFRVLKIGDNTMSHSKKRFFFVPFVFIFTMLVSLVVSRGIYAENAGSETTVYVTNSGKRYHRETCGSLSRSKIAVSLGNAIRSDYEPCSICDPPMLIREDSQAAVTMVPAALYRVNQARDPAAGTSGLRSFASADISRMVPAEVVGHVDGDTVRVRIKDAPGSVIPAELGVVETIRLIGVDTPETVHPSRPVERFGKEASDFTKARLLNKPVYLAFDWDLRDHYGRLLAYIYTVDGDCFNARLIRDGYGHAYTRFTFQFMDEFRAQEREARERKRGLWGE
jgi:micrococcal nuclease